MMPRKQDETDAHYISRLEISNRDLKAHNEAMRKSQKQLHRIIVPAAQQAGLVLQCAAEMAGVTEDAEVGACIAGLEALGSYSWKEDDLHVPPMPAIAMPPEPYSGDVEMILKSALEKAKAEQLPWKPAKGAALYAKVDEIEFRTIKWRDLWWEICDALEGLEFSQQMLRLDMRSCMYSHCHARIAQALLAAVDKQDAECPLEHPPGPDGPDDALPF